MTLPRALAGRRAARLRLRSQPRGKMSLFILDDGGAAADRRHSRHGRGSALDRRRRRADRARRRPRPRRRRDQRRHAAVRGATTGRSCRHRPARGAAAALSGRAADGATAEVGPADLTVWEFDLLGDDAALALVSADPSERGWYHARAGPARSRDAARPTILHQSAWQMQGPAVDPIGQARRLPRRLVQRPRPGRRRHPHPRSRHRQGHDARADGNCPTSRRSSGATTRASGSPAGRGSARSMASSRLDGTVEWIERRRRDHRHQQLPRASITPAPDKKGFAAVREAVGAAAGDRLQARAATRWAPVTKLNGDVAQGLRRLSRGARDRLEGAGRARHGGPRPAAARSRAEARCR